MIASKNDQNEIVKLLLEQEGIDPNTSDVYLFLKILISIRKCSKRRSSSQFAMPNLIRMNKK